jgi:hypothetical protein
MVVEMYSFYFVFGFLVLLAWGRRDPPAVDCSGVQTSLSNGAKTATPHHVVRNYYAWKVNKTFLGPPSITIERGESALLQYNIDVMRSLRTQESIFSVSGTITITNDPNVPTVGLQITDTIERKSGCTSGEYVLFAGPVPVTSVLFHPVLSPGETHSFPYTVEVGLSHSPLRTTAAPSKGALAHVDTAACLVRRGRPFAVANLYFRATPRPRRSTTSRPSSRTCTTSPPRDTPPHL